MAMMKSVAWWRSAPGIRTILVAAALIATAGLTWWTYDYRLDDALIYARYARNFADGHGLVFNEGEHRNAASSSLYLWLLVIVGLTQVDIPAAANVISGISIGLAAAMLGAWLVPANGRRAAAASGAAAILFATSPLNYAAIGMETPVALLFLTGALVAWRADRVGWMAVASGLALATRSETILLVGLLFLLVAWRRRAIPWRAGAITVAINVPFLVFNASYYRTALPATLGAKIDQGRSGYWGGDWLFLTNTRDALDQVYVSAPILLLVAALALLPVAVYTVYQRSAHMEPALEVARDELATNMAAAWVTGIFAGSLVCFYTVIRVHSYHWYLTPISWAMSILIPLGALFLYELAVGLNPRSRVMAISLACALAATLAVGHGLRWRSLNRGANADHLAVARYIESTGKSPCTVASAEIGHVGWYTDCTIVDVLGLVSPGNSDALARRDVNAWLERYHPDFIETFFPVAPYEQGAINAVIDGRYRVVDPPVTPQRLLLQSTGEMKRPDGWLLGGDVGGGSLSLNEALYSVGGVRRAGLFMHVTQEYTFAAAAAGGGTFTAWVGLSDGAERSDGVRFIVSTTLGSERRELLQRVVKAGKWERIEVALPPAPAGQRWDLVLGTDVAPGGRSDFGWAVWGEPRVSTP